MSIKLIIIYFAIVISLIIVGYIIKLNNNTIEFREFKIKAIHSFDSIKQDIGLIKN